MPRGGAAAVLIGTTTLGFGSLRGFGQVAEWRGQWLAPVRGVQVRGTGSVVGVAPVGAVSAVGSGTTHGDIAGGRGDSELGVSGIGAAQSAASEWGLGGGARAWVGVGGDVCGPGAISRRGVRRHVGAGGADEGICAAQRGVSDAHKIRALRRRARERLADPADRNHVGPKVCYTREELRSLRELTDAGLPPWSGAKHRLATVPIWRGCRG